MPTFENGFYEIAALLSVASITGAIALWLRQPLIMAFIAVGVLVGPSGFGWVGASDEVSLFAKLGIALLLFVVGLKLDPYEIRTVGPVALVVGGGQIVLTGSIGYLIGLGLGLENIPALYVATALTFSSTIIIVKLLSDKREIDALHGRIALGVLIVQDITVVAVMIILTAFNGSTAPAEIGHGALVLLVLAKGTGFLLAVSLFTRYGLPQLLHLVARSTELLVLFAIAWAIALGSIAEILGFSQEVGAFIAGVALATTAYRAPLGARLVSLRDFLLFFFFLDLGSHIDLHYLGAQLIPALILSLFVLAGKPLMVVLLMGQMGYRKYTSALAGLSLSQISEFSLILGALGISLGHIDEATMGLITLVGLITIGISTYMIIYSHVLYPKLAPVLNRLERQIPHPEEQISQHEECPTHVDVIVFGLGRYGGRLVQDLQRQGLGVLGVDFDPELVAFWRQQGLWTFYGDAADPEFAAMLPLEQPRWVVSTIPGRDLGLTLLQGLKQRGYEGQVALTSHQPRDRKALEAAGADLVLLPFSDAAQEAARIISSPFQSSLQ